MVLYGGPEVQITQHENKLKITSIIKKTKINK